MPKAWTKKDERQYEHIRDHLEEDGKKAETAREIAARTVNKQRRKEGRTPNKTTQGTGNPRLPLEERTRDELYNRARAMGVAGRSKMGKGELIKAIRARR